jgi:hypothetical protein
MVVRPLLETPMKTSAVQAATGAVLLVAALASIGLIDGGRSEPVRPNSAAATPAPAPAMVYPAGDWPDAPDLPEYDESQNALGNLTAKS